MLKAIASMVGRGKSSSELLKQATAQKKAGDLDGAIKSLRDAYKAIKRNGETQTIKPFLRLPAYLQLAGRNDEAWAQFQSLLVDGYPGQMKVAELLPMDHAAIYDAQRLFLQREGKASEAVAFGVASHVSWGKGLETQQRYRELKRHMGKTAVEACARQLLKKAGKQDSQDKLVEILLKCSIPSQSDTAEVMRAVNSLVCE